MQSAPELTFVPELVIAFAHANVAVLDQFRT